MSQDDAGNSSGKKTKGKLGKWILRLAIVFVLLFVVLIVAIVLIAKSFVNPDYIVSVIEAENNCRVEIQSTDVSLFSFPARIEMQGVKITYRDTHADAGTKLAERPPIEGPGVIFAKSVALEANLFDLLRKRISVKHLTIDELIVSEFLIEREGGYSIDPLFDPPQTVAGSPNPEYADKKERRDLAKERRKKEKEEREKQGTPQQFDIAELGVPASMEAFNINNANIKAKIRRDKTRITFSNVQIKVSDIDLDPGDLLGHNKAKVSISCHLDIEDKEYETKYADLDIRSDGDVIPFDPVTGYINPDITYQITVLKGSKMDAVPPLIRLSKNVSKLEKYGLKLDALSENIVLQEDVKLTMGYRDHALTFLEPVEMRFGDHFLVLKPGAWLHTGNNKHEAAADILLSKAASEKALNGSKEFLTKKYSGFLDKEKIESFTDKALSPIVRDGQLYLPFTSKGNFNKPDVDVDIELEDVLLEALSGENLGDLLENDDLGDLLDTLKDKALGD